MAGIPIQGTLYANGAFPLAESFSVTATPIVGADLSALENWSHTETMVVGQWGYAQDTGKTYQLSSIGTPPGLLHSWTEFSASSAVLQSNIAIVDQTNGNDSTGIVGDLSKPFATYAAADSAISAIGDAALTNKYAIKFTAGEHSLATMVLRPFVNVICDSQYSSLIHVTGDITLGTEWQTTIAGEILLQNITVAADTVLSADLNSIGGTSEIIFALMVFENVTLLGGAYCYGRKYRINNPPLPPYYICPDRFIIKQCRIINDFNFDCGTLINLQTDSLDAAFNTTADLGRSIAFNYGAQFSDYNVDGNGDINSNTLLGSYVSGTVYLDGPAGNVHSDSSSLFEASITTAGGASEDQVVFDLDSASRILDDSSTGSGQSVAESLDDTRYSGTATVTVGGVTAGDSFTNKPPEYMIKKILEKYLDPAFSAFSIFGQSTLLEVGDSISGAKSFVWATTNSGNVQANSIDITDISGGSIPLFTGLANDGIEPYTFPSPIQLVTQGSYVWQIQGMNTLLNTFNRNYTVTWWWREYWGTSTNSSLTEAQIKALASSQLSASAPGTYAFAAGGYKYFAWPTSFTQPTIFKDSATLLDVAMAPTYTIDITNSFGVLKNYTIYRTLNQLGSSISIIVS